MTLVNAGDEDEYDDTPPIRPNCPACLHPMSILYDGSGWHCEADGQILLIDEVTNPGWWAKATGNANNAPEPA